MPVKLERGSRSTASGLLIELSEDRARVSQLTRGKYEEGDKVVIQTPADCEIAGTIRWVSNGVARIWLDDPLPQPELHNLRDINRRELADA